jgi:uncharacterized protein (DUF58 family)
VNALRAAIVRGARRSGRRGEGVRSARPGDGYEFSQLRGYVEGDDPRRIDWSASARIGALQTRVYLEETALVFAAIVDESPSMRVGRSRRLSEAAQEAVTAWFNAGENEDRAKRIVDDRLVEGKRPAISVHANGPFYLVRTLDLALRVLPRGSSLLVVTDGFDLPDDDGDILVRLAHRCDATVLLASDPWRDGIPLRGLRRIRDAETGRSRLLFFGRRERATFVAAVAAREAALTARFRETGWRVGTLNADDGRRSLESAFGLR